MRRIVLSFLLLCTLDGAAQNLKYSNNTALVKVIPVPKHCQGLEYRAGIRVRCRPADSSAAAGLLSLQAQKNNWDFLPATHRSAAAAVQDSNWQQLQVAGYIDTLASQLWIYLTTSGNGDFSFDDISLQVRSLAGDWQTIRVPNGDFEASKPQAALAGLKNTQSVTRNSTSHAAIRKDLKGQYLELRTRDGQLQVPYGHNPMAGRYIQCNGSPIYFERYGQGAPLLLLHGNGGSINSFREQIPAFAQHFDVIAVDTRGQGNSIDTLSPTFSYTQFASDMKVLLDSLGIRKVTIIGWSDGGNTALLLAGRHPELVDQLVVMGANLNPADTSVRKKIVQQTQRDIRHLQQANPSANKVTIRLLELLLREPDIRAEQLASIKARTLVMAGEKDIVLERHTRLIAALITGASLRILKGQTHFVVEEAPELFNREVLQFLESR